MVGQVDPTASINNKSNSISSFASAISLSFVEASSCRPTYRVPHLCPASFAVAACCYPTANSRTERERERNIRPRCMPLVTSRCPCTLSLGRGQSPARSIRLLPNRSTYCCRLPNCARPVARSIPHRYAYTDSANLQGDSCTQHSVAHPPLSIWASFRFGLNASSLGQHKKLSTFHSVSQPARAHSQECECLSALKLQKQMHRDGATGG